MAASSNSKPSFKIRCKGRPNFSVTIQAGKVVVAPSNPIDKHQHWYKYDSYSKMDSEGYPSFALVNSATSQAIKHGGGSGKPVELVPFDPFNDDSTFWTQGKDLGSGFAAIRMQKNIGLNMEASSGTDAIIASSWSNAENQQWNIEQYATFRWICKAGPDYSIALKPGTTNGIAIFVKNDPKDECQHWYKEEISGKKDAAGFPALVYINKGTGQPLKHGLNGQQNIPKYNPTSIDNPILFAEVQTFTGDFKRIRCLAVSINHALRPHNGVAQGLKIGAFKWEGGKDVELWKFEPFNPPQPALPTVKLCSKAGPNFSLTIKSGQVVLASANPNDGFQHWHKYEHPNIKDSQGYSSFVLVNKITKQAIKHATGANKPVQLVLFNPATVSNDSILWTKVGCSDSSYSEIRVQNNITLNLNVSGGTVKGFVAVINDKWYNGADNELWKIEPY